MAIKKAVDLRRGDQVGTYGTAKLTVWSRRITLNTVRVITNMNTRLEYHVADDVQVYG